MMTTNNPICIISNYDRDDEARCIQENIACPSYVVDSSGRNKFGFYQTRDPFFAGCFNKSCEIFLASDASHCLFVCSDVKGNLQSVINRIEHLPENIGVYSPAILGQGWHHGKPQKYGLRDVPFCEGIIHCSTRGVIEKVYPVDAKNYPHAYGIDFYTGYMASAILGKRVVIDDGINVYHPFGTSYDANQARRDMFPYITSKGPDFVQWFQKNVATLRYA